MTKVHNIEKGEVLSLVVVNERLGASLPRISNIVMEKNLEDADRPTLCVKAATKLSAPRRRGLLERGCTCPIGVRHSGSCPLVRVRVGGGDASGAA